MSARVPYLAGLLGGSRPPHPQSTSLRPPRRLFAPELPFAQRLPLDTPPSRPPSAQTTSEALTSRTPRAGSTMSADLARGSSLAHGTSTGSPPIRAGSPRLHDTHSHEDQRTRVQEQPGWMPSKQPGVGVRSPWTAAGDAPGAHGERNRPAGPSAGDPRYVTGLTPRRPGEQAAPGPFAAQSGEPASSSTGRAGSDPRTETGAGVARSPTGSISSFAEGNTVSAALAVAAARSLAERVRREPDASDAALALPAARLAASDGGYPGSAVGAHTSREGAQGTASEAEPRPGSLIPAPPADRLADWLGIRALSSDLPPGAEPKQRNASARVSIGTIEVTVVPPPASTPPVAASVGPPAAQLSAQPAHAANRPVADQLRLGARRWYGMAQA